MLNLSYLGSLNKLKLIPVNRQYLTGQTTKFRGRAWNKANVTTKTGRPHCDSCCLTDSICQNGKLFSGGFPQVDLAKLVVQAKCSFDTIFAARNRAVSPYGQVVQCWSFQYARDSLGTAWMCIPMLHGPRWHQFFNLRQIAESMNGRNLRGFAAALTQLPYQWLSKICSCFNGFAKPKP